MNNYSLFTMFSIGVNFIKYFVLFLTITNTLIPIFILNIFNAVGEDSISSRFEISLYISDTGEIRIIDFEDYIKQVVYAEIPASFEIEAIKAQAIAARSYTYKKILSNGHDNADVCNDPNHCQAWKASDDSEAYKKITQAVEETSGEVAVYNGEVINAVYHASSGGFTEDCINVWNGSKIDYLVAVKSDGENEIMKDFETIVEIPVEEFLEKLKISKNEKLKIKILSKTEGNRVNQIDICGQIFEGNELRNIFNLRSSNFEIISKNKIVKIIVKGHGHGVGLSQWGAQAMALEGKTYEEIIKHYYTGVKICNIDINSLYYSQNY